MNDGSKKHIMLVEDEALIAMHEKLVLERLGYSVGLALTGEKAIESFTADTRVDLVLMDIDLGRGIDGTETARILLRIRDVPIVFLSSHTEPEIVEKTENITSYGYISKNSSATVLQASIKMAFKLFDARTGMIEANRKLKATLHALPDLFFEVDLEGRYYDLHCPDPSLLFAPAEDLIGVRIPERLPADVSAIIMEAIEEANVNGLSKGHRYRLAVASGPAWFDVSVSRMEGRPGDPHFILICRDISEQVRIDEDLQESKRYAERLLNVSAEIILATDQNGIITILNDSGHRLLGYEPPELIGKPWIETCLPPEIRAEVRDFLDNLIDGHADTLVPHENFVIGKDGRRLLILWHNTVLKDRNGRVTGLLSSGEDIGAYKELEERYRTIVEASPDNITVTDLQGSMLMYSPKALPMFGYGPGEDMVGHPITDFMAPEDRARAAGNLERMARGEVLGVEEYRGIRRNGSVFDMEVNGEFIRDRDGRPTRILFIVRDISSRKHLVGKYKLLFDLSPIGIALYEHATGRFLDANTALLRMLGYGKDELLRLSYSDVTPPEYLQISRDRVGTLTEAALVETYSKEYIRKDGSRLPISISGVVFFDDEQRLVVWGLIEDITERLEAQKKVAALLADKDLILREVHHRIKNNFGVIRSLLRLQAQTMPEGPATEGFKATESRVQSMALLYEKLYCSAGFVDAPVADYLPVLVCDIVASFPRGDRIEVVMDVDDFRLEAALLQPLGILINEVVTNSMKHAFVDRERGSITVRVKRTGDRVSVSIGDDGAGLPADMEPGASSGFGLTLVSMLAQQLRAALRIERNSGTNVIVEFDAHL